MAQAIVTIEVQQNNGTPIADIHFTKTGFTKADAGKLIKILQGSTLRDLIIGIADTAIRLAGGTVSSPSAISEDVSADVGLGG